MKALITGLFSVSALAFAAPSFAEHHGDGGHAMPTPEECEVLHQAHADSMESGEAMSEEDLHRHEQCEGNMDMEHGDGEHHADGEHGDHHEGGAHDDGHGDHD